EQLDAVLSQSDGVGGGFGATPAGGAKRGLDDIQELLRTSRHEQLQLGRATWPDDVHGDRSRDVPGAMGRSIPVPLRFAAAAAGLAAATVDGKAGRDRHQPGGEQDAELLRVAVREHAAAAFRGHELYRAGPEQRVRVSGGFLRTWNRGQHGDVSG